jgi:predicted GH43/DUF377 family glycosyl hydrolase
MKPQIIRNKNNPIVTPGNPDWRKAVTFNPGVVFDNGKFYMLERAAGNLRPFQCYCGLLESDNGIDFLLKNDQPVLGPDDLGFPTGSVQDPRVVKIENYFYVCAAFRPYSYSCSPTGTGLPDYTTMWGPKDRGINNTRSVIFKSPDLINYEFIAYTTPPEVDDRDNVLFPEKINGKFALLRRPMSFVGIEYGTDSPGIWISYSDDLTSWSNPVLVTGAEQEWEGGKIGASTPPVKTDQGWLLFYHGVDKNHIYRLGALLLDINNPEKVIGRTPDFIMEPEEYYEKFGLVIPNVIFPTAAIEVEDQLYIYYGCCDTSIGLATVKTSDILNYMDKE